MSTPLSRLTMVALGLPLVACGAAQRTTPAASSPAAVATPARSAEPRAATVQPAPTSTAAAPGSTAPPEPAPAASAPVETTTSAPAEPPPVLAQVKLVRFDEPDSVARFERSRHKTDFFRLANQFEAQQNGGFCGPASAVIVLNALRVDDDNPDKPRDTSSVPRELVAQIPARFEPFFTRYTQGALLDERFERVKPKAVFFGQPATPGGKPTPGLGLRHLGDILTAHGLDVQIHVMSDSVDEKELKKEIVENLRTSGDYIIVNYFRPALGQPGGGHLSPLGAYDQKSDSFLILDVNANAQRWVWVESKSLFDAMRTQGGKERRGFLGIREKAK